MTEQDIAKVRQAIIDSIHADFAEEIAAEKASGDEEQFHAAMQELSIYNSLARFDKAIALLNKETK
jgi:hypothetical protein